MTLAPAEPPLEPLPDEARDWLIVELAKPEYQAAKPTLIDMIGQAIRDWLATLFTGSAGAPPLAAILVTLAIVTGIVVVAIVVSGPPRANRRSARTDTLFGVEEARTAAAMRADAEAAARRGDWSAAIADRYRAIARSLTERDVVHAMPGTTAREFATLAAAAFPSESGRLDRAAAAFDDVRYLGRRGGEPEYRELAELDARLAAARPVLEETPA